MQAVLATETERAHLRPIHELHPVLMTAKSVVILDIETTGFSPEKFSEIIEIGAVRLDIEKRAITGMFSCLIQPSETFSITPKITELTTIDWKQVRDKPFIEEVLPDFAKFIGDDPIVAHNAEFDWPRFLVPAFCTVGLHATNEAICTMLLAKELYPGRGRKGYNLESLCEMFGHEMVGHHRAYVDCKWTASIFLRMLDEYREQHIDDDIITMYSSEFPPNPLPSSIPYVDFSDMRVTRVSYSPGQSKRHGPKIFVNTNFGKIAYSARRRLWTVKNLWTDRNAPAQVWGRNILRLLNTDAETLVSTGKELYEKQLQEQKKEN